MLPPASATHFLDVGCVTEETYRIFYTHAVENLFAFARGAPVRVIQP